MSPSAERRPLQAELLRDDPRIRQAKQLIAAAISDHAAPLAKIQPPRTDRTVAYQQLLTELTEARGAAPFFPYLASGLGNGPWVELADGSVKLDFISGIGVYGLGHSHPKLVAAAIDAAVEDVVMQGNLQQHPPSLRMCQQLLRLAHDAGADLRHCLLTTSGAMANENALKIALHAKYPADRILCFDNCFAGRSLATASLTDRPQYRNGLPLTLAVDYLPYWDAQDPSGSTERAVSTMQHLLQRHPGRYAALWAELVAGEGGYYAGDATFFQALAAPLKAAGIPIIFDEVQTFGRLSHPFAFAHFGLGQLADIVTIGKITQVCATLYRTELKPKGPILSQTFTGSSSSIACGLAVLKELHDHKCFGPDGTNLQLAAYFARRLNQLGQKYPGHLSGPYGLGMMVACTPGDGKPETAKWFVDELFAAGLLGFTCGSNPTRLRFLPPPAATTQQHIDVAIDVLDQVLLKYSTR